jgi:hypothetical protein
MALLHLHRDTLHAGPRPGSGGRVLHWLVIALRRMHRAILKAKLRRLRNELICRGGYVADKYSDASKFPQAPVFLGDKWDF